MEAIGSLAGGIAHDFNNLLSVILGQSEFLQRRLDAADPALKRVEEIRKAGERASLLTRQLLAFSRKQVLIPEVLDPGSVITDIASMLRRLIGEDVVLETIVEPGHRIRKGGPRAARAGDHEPRGERARRDARRAARSRGECGMPISTPPTKQAHLAIPSGRYVLLAVSDTGTGMTDATRAHVFEPFFTTKEGGKGTGLGLATVYGIVKQSDGYVSLDTEAGHGTTFKIYLPRSEGVAEARTPSAQPAPSDAGDGDGASRRGRGDAPRARAGGAGGERLPGPRGRRRGRSPAHGRGPPGDDRPAADRRGDAGHQRARGGRASRPFASRR